VRKAALFSGYLTDGDGSRRRATRQELAEANRLWWRHRDLREQPCDLLSTTFLAGAELNDVVADEWTQIGLDSLGAA
jgi:hypothetical protein